MLNGKNILLGVTGSIAAYKAVETARRLTEDGARILVIMTEAACRFVSPITFEAVSGSPAHTDLFEGYFKHINLAKEANLFVVAPASANTISKFACGIADNLLTATYLAYEGPVLIAPAMNSRMYNNPIIQRNIKELKKVGVMFIGPESGKLACGEEGIGRMAEVEDIIEASKSALTPKDLKGHKILVTAGPTREAIDPIRFLSNRSSGKMGFALAAAAYRRGAVVTLISGPTALKPPKGITFIPVENAVDMQNAVLKNFQKSTDVIMAAAVCDFAPSVISKSKIPKTKKLTVDLKETTDILHEIGRKKGKRFLVGFAAETGMNIQRAKEKLRDKNLDLMVLNDVTQKGAGFDLDTNIATLINRKGEATEMPLMKKEDLANVILDSVSGFKKSRNK